MGEFNTSQRTKDPCFKVSQLKERYVFQGKKINKLKVNKNNKALFKREY